MRWAESKQAEAEAQASADMRWEEQAELPKPYAQHTGAAYITCAPATPSLPPASAAQEPNTWYRLK
jgi:hypothetical protein